MLTCRGLETKLKHCLVGSNIFADETEGVDPKQQARTPPYLWTMGDPQHLLAYSLFLHISVAVIGGSRVCP